MPAAPIGPFDDALQQPPPSPALGVQTAVAPTVEQSKPDGQVSFPTVHCSVQNMSVALVAQMPPWQESLSMQFSPVASFATVLGSVFEVSLPAPSVAVTLSW